MNQQQKVDNLFFLDSSVGFSTSSLFIPSIEVVPDLEKKGGESIALSIGVAADKLNYTLSHPPSSPLLSTSLVTALISTLCAATVAFLYNRLHWWFVTKRETKIKISENLVVLVTELSDVSINYWLKNYSRKFSKDLLSDEMKIKSHLSLINTSIGSLIERLPKKNISDGNKLKVFHDELFDLITGDDFESQTRKADKAKVAKISTKCLSLRVVISTMKI